MTAAPVDQSGRREMLRAAMDSVGLDVLVLGRHDNADWATGRRRLWTAGTTPMSAQCIIVAATGLAHVLSSWDAGVPDSVPFEDLVPMSWDPVRESAALASIDGLGGARRIGVDAFSPSLERTLAESSPGAELVPADELLARLRRIKDRSEIDAIEAACRVAWRGVTAALDDGPGSPAGRALEAMGRGGITIPSSGVHVRTETGAVVIDIGVIRDGYEGGVGGRFERRRRDEAEPLVDACRAGATWSDLEAVANADRWCIRGVGRGWEHPVLAADHGRDEVLDAGMVVSVADGDHRDIVEVTDDGPRILSAHP